MTIETFSVKNRLRTAKDACGDVFIQGRQGQIYGYGPDQLGVMFLPPSKTDTFGRWCPRVWNRLREAGKAAGMTCHQNGDSEGCLLFDGANERQSKLACQIAKVKRLCSPAQLEQRIASGENSRFTAVESTIL